MRVHEKCPRRTAIRTRANQNDMQTLLESPPEATPIAPYYEGWQSRSERRAEFFLKSGLCLFSFSGGSGFSKRDPGL
jgi:hypothetical protein